MMCHLLTEAPEADHVKEACMRHLTEAANEERVDQEQLEKGLERSKPSSKRSPSLPLNNRYFNRLRSRKELSLKQKSARFSPGPEPSPSESVLSSILKTPLIKPVHPFVEMIRKEAIRHGPVVNIPKNLPPGTKCNFESHFFFRNRYTLLKVFNGNFVDPRVEIQKSERNARGKKTKLEPTPAAKFVHSFYLQGSINLPMILKGARLDWEAMWIAVDEERIKTGFPPLVPLNKLPKHMRPQKKRVPKKAPPKKENLSQLHPVLFKALTAPLTHHPAAANQSIPVITIDEDEQENVPVDRSDAPSIHSPLKIKYIEKSKEPQIQSLEIMDQETESLPTGTPDQEEQTIIQPEIEEIEVVETPEESVLSLSPNVEQSQEDANENSLVIGARGKYIVLPRQPRIANGSLCRIYSIQKSPQKEQSPVQIEDIPTETPQVAKTPETTINEAPLEEIQALLSTESQVEKSKEPQNQPLEVINQERKSPQIHSIGLKIKLFENQLVANENADQALIQPKEEIEENIEQPQPVLSTEAQKQLEPALPTEAREQQPPQPVLPNIPILPEIHQQLPQFVFPQSLAATNNIFMPPIFPYFGYPEQPLLPYIQYLQFMQMLSLCSTMSPLAKIFSNNNTGNFGDS